MNVIHIFLEQLNSADKETQLKALKSLRWVTSLPYEAINSLERLYSSG